MSKKKEEDPKRFVEVEDCHERHARLELALFGKDGRGGIVADLQAIKIKLGLARQVLLPIVSTILTAVITAWILGNI